MAKITSIMRETEKAVLAYFIDENENISNRTHWFPRSALGIDGEIADWLFRKVSTEDLIEEENDRFGRTISPQIVSKLNSYSRKLTNLGFRESKKKKWLFYMYLNLDHPSGDDLTVFVDFRGSEVMPIYELTCALVYVSDLGEFRIEATENDTAFIIDKGLLTWTKWNGFGASPSDTQSYISSFIREYLSFHNIPTRETFDQFSVKREKYEEFHDTDADKLERKVRDASEYFEEYSNAIKRFSKKEQWEKCRICSKIGIPSGYWASAIKGWEEEGVRLELHHVSYIPEIVIPVCKSCHSEIHYSEKFLHLKPEMKREEWLEITSREQ